MIVNHSFCKGFGLLAWILSPVGLAAGELGSEQLNGEDRLSPTIAANTEDLFRLSLEDLMHIKIESASRTEASVRELPVTSFVITRDELRDNGYNSLVEVLKDLPGVRVSQPGSGIEGELFVMQGLVGNTFTKILVNGLPLTPSVVSGMPLAEQVNVTDVERIEVIYGPAAALYGADAVSGVINIVTYVPDEDVLIGDAMAGEWGYLHSHLFGSVALLHDPEELRLTAYALFSRRADTPIKLNHPGLYDRRLYEGSGPSKNQVPFAFGDVPSQSYAFGAQMRYHGFELAYEHMGRSDFSSLGLRTDSYFWDDDHARWAETIQRLSLVHQAELTDLHFRTNLSWLRYRLDNQSYFSFVFSNKDPSTYGQRNNAYKYQASDDLLLEEIITWRLPAGFQAVGGISLELSGALPKTNDLSEPFDESGYSAFSTTKPPPDPIFGEFGYNPVTYQNLGVFLQGAYNSRWLNAIAGVRFDQNSDFDPTVNPRTAAQINLTDGLSVRGSFNTAYKVASPYYRFNSVVGLEADGRLNYLFIPNPELSPLRYWAAEAAIRYLPSRNVSIELVGQRSRISNLFQIIRVDASQFPGAREDEHAYTYTNDKGAQTDLVSLDLRLRMRELVRSIHLGAELFATVSKGSEVLPGSGERLPEVRMVPALLGKVRLSAKIAERLYLGLDGTLSSGWYARGIASRAEFEQDFNHIAGYFVLDAMARCELSGGLWLQLKLLNVLDARYAGIGAVGSVSNDLQYNPQMSRVAYLGLGYEFDLELEP